MQRLIHKKSLTVLSLLFSLLFLCFPALSAVQDQDSKDIATFGHRSALDKSGGVIGNTISSYTFTDTNGMPVHMDSFRGKPLIISLVYTSCYQICQMTTQHLKKMVEMANESLGVDKFNVVTIGFDAMVDTPEMMSDYARSRGINIDNWSFLSTDIATANRLVEELGFTYVRTSSGFDHVLQATVIDQKGKIYTQVYGESYDAPLFMEPLKELVYKRPTNRGIIANIENQVRFFCTVYDPTTGAYRFDYSFFVGMFIGFIIISSTFFFLIKEFYINPRKKSS